jgi:hypothetical protein
MKYKLLSLTFVIGLALSCSHTNNYHRRIVQQPSVMTQIPLTLPSWLIKLPDNENLVIGIAKTTNDSLDMANVAREMATVQYARNLSSYNINKHIQAKIYSEDIVDEEKRSVIFQVSDPHQIREIYERLGLVEYFILHKSYFVGLFRYNNISQTVPVGVAANESQASTLLYKSEQPDWYKENTIIVSENEITSHQLATSACLIDAWETANQDSRLELANYYSLNVQSILDNESIEGIERQRQVVALETLYNLKNIQPRRHYISAFYLDNNIHYRVFVELLLSK